MMRRPLVAVDGVSRVFTSGAARHIALEGISFDVADGEFVALLGPSGCGKSTLLRLVADVIAPTSGRLGGWGIPGRRPARRPPRLRLPGVRPLPVADRARQRRAAAPREPAGAAPRPTTA